MDTSDVKIVFKPDQLERIGAFRYQAYIGEKGKSADHVNHAVRNLIAPIDRDRFQPDLLPGTQS